MAWQSGDATCFEYTIGYHNFEMEHTVSFLVEWSLDFSSSLETQSWVSLLRWLRAFPWLQSPKTATAQHDAAGQSGQKVAVRSRVDITRSWVDHSLDSGGIH